MKQWTVGVMLAAMLTVSACSSSHEDTPAPGQDRAEHDSLSWQPGTDDTLIAQGPEHLVRCWPSNAQQDCIVALTISRAQSAPEAPDVMYYFRFQSHELPRTEKAINQLALEDGYACEVTHRDNIKTLQEFFWKSGQRVEERTSNPVNDRASWSLQEIGALSKHYGIEPQRAYLVCMMLDDVVSREGLIGLDSAVISPARLFIPAARFAEAPPLALPVGSSTASPIAD